MEARNADSLEAGTAPPGPSDAEAIPAEPADIQLAPPPHLNLLLGSQGPRLTVRMIPRPMGGASSKRPGEPVDT